MHIILIQFIIRKDEINDMAVYLITGASGYLGSMLAEYILKTDRSAKVIALARDGEKMGRRLPQDSLFVFQANLCEDGWAERFFMEGQVMEGAGLPDHIIHCAAVTDSSEMVSHPVEVISSIVNATQNVLEFARQCKIKSMVYLSSMEVYGRVNDRAGHLVTEDEAGMGRIDVLDVRSCYPLGKRMSENICYSYYREYGVPVKIARLAQTFGRGIRWSDNRIFAQLIRAVKKGTDIVLHTDGTSVGNYCGIDDVLRGIMTILEKGEDGEAYNVVNEKNTMTIREMAELVATQAAGGKIRVVYEIPQGNPYGYATKTGLHLSGKKLAGLGWQAKDSLLEMYLNASFDQRE